MRVKLQTQKKEFVRTQRRAQVFHEQMAMRIHDQLVVSRATEKEAISRRVVENRLVCGSKFRIKYNSIEMNYEVVWTRSVKKKMYMT